MELQEFELTDTFKYILYIDASYPSDLKVVVKCDEVVGFGVAPAIFRNILDGGNILRKYMENVAYCGDLVFCLCYDETYKVKLEFTFHSDVERDVLQDDSMFRLTLTDLKTKKSIHFPINRGVLSRFSTKRFYFDSSVVHWAYTVTVLEPRLTQSVVQYHQMNTFPDMGHFYDYLRRQRSLPASRNQDDMNNMD
jgi:hypothetical protein